MTSFSPSTAIRVNSSTPISECVALMNDRGIGSVIVTEMDAPDELLGIFTERDLLRNIALIQTGGYWDFPVSSVMSRPVITVERTHIDHAATLMLKYGFRHLPVMETQPNGHRLLCGMLSIRDILRSNEIRHAPHLAALAPETPPTISLRIRSLDPAFEASFTRLIQKLIKPAQILNPPHAANQMPSPGHSLFVIDADGIDTQELAQSVRSQLGLPDTRAIFVIHGKAAIAKPALKALEELRATGKLALFAKPVNLLSLSDALGRIRNP